MSAGSIGEDGISGRLRARQTRNRVSPGATGNTVDQNRVKTSQSGTTLSIQVVEIARVRSPVLKWRASRRRARAQ